MRGRRNNEKTKRGDSSRCTCRSWSTVAVCLYTPQASSLKLMMHRIYTGLHRNSRLPPPPTDSVRGLSKHSRNDGAGFLYRCTAIVVKSKRSLPRGKDP